MHEVENTAVWQQPHLTQPRNFRAVAWTLDVVGVSFGTKLHDLRTFGWAASFRNLIRHLRVGNLLDVELGRVVQRGARQADAVEHHLCFLNTSMEDDSPSVHQNDVRKEMENVGSRLVDGEQHDSVCCEVLVKKFGFADIAGKLSQRIHDFEGTEAVQPGCWLVAEQNLWFCQKLKRIWIRKAGSSEFFNSLRLQRWVFVFHRLTDISSSCFRWDGILRATSPSAASSANSWESAAWVLSETTFCTIFLATSKATTHHEVEMFIDCQPIQENVVLRHKARNVGHLRAIHDLAIETDFAFQLSAKSLRQSR